MSASLRVVLGRPDRTYYPNDLVKGHVVVVSEQALSHSGLNIEVEGLVNMQYANSKSVSIWDAMVNSLKPIEVVKVSYRLEPSGKFPAGGAEIPFEFPLRPTGSHPLYETYHGVYLSVRYRIHVELDRGFFLANIRKSSEFIVNVPGQGRPSRFDDDFVRFEMRPEKLENVRKRSIDAIPPYRVKGVLETLAIDITAPLRGTIRVVESQVDIKSVELQLVRVEQCSAGDSTIREATEIQNLQIGEGHVCKRFEIPIFMIPPRLFSCPTVRTKCFEIMFEINIIILFMDQHQVTENFPLRLYRGPRPPDRPTPQ